MDQDAINSAWKFPPGQPLLRSARGFPEESYAPPVLQLPSGQLVLPHPLGPNHMIREAAGNEFRRWVNSSRGSGGSINNLDTFHGTANAPRRFVPSRPLDSARRQAMPGATAPLSGPLPEFQKYASSGETSALAGNGRAVHGTSNAPPRFAPRRPVDNALRTSMPGAAAPLSGLLPDFENYASSGKAPASRGNGGSHQFTSASHREGATGVPSGSVPAVPLNRRRGPSLLAPGQEIQVTDEHTVSLYHVLDAQKALTEQLDILYHDACKCESACAYFADVMQTYKDGSLSDDALSVWTYFYELKRSLACFRGSSQDSEPGSDSGSEESQFGRPEFQKYASSVKISGSGGNGGALHGTGNAPPRFDPRRPVDSGLRQSMPGPEALLSGQLPEFQSCSRTSGSAANGGAFKAPAGAPAGFVGAAAGGRAPRPQIPVACPLQRAPVSPPWNISTTGTKYNSASHCESPTGVTSRFVAPLSSRPGPSVSEQRAPPAQGGSKQTEGRSEERLRFSIPEVYEKIEMDASSTGSSQDLFETGSDAGSEESQFGTPELEKYASSVKTSGSGGNGGALYGTGNAAPRFGPCRPVDSALRQSMAGPEAPLSGQLPEFQSCSRTSGSAANGGAFKAPAGSPVGFVGAAAGGSAPRPQIPVACPLQRAPVSPPLNISTTGTEYNSASHCESPTGVTPRFVAPPSSRPGPSVSAQRAPPAQGGSKQTKGRSEERLRFSIPEVYEMIEMDASSTGSSQDLCETESDAGSEESEFGMRGIMAQVQGLFDGLTRGLSKLQQRKATNLSGVKISR